MKIMNVLSKFVLSLFYFSVFTINAQVEVPQNLEFEHHHHSIEPAVCGTPHLNREKIDSHLIDAVEKAPPINPYAYTQSIHNAVAKWEGGSVYRFDYGTSPGADDIYNGHLLNVGDVHTGGHSFPELQTYALAQGTNFNIGDLFYLNLYYNAGSTVPDQSFPLQFLWEDLGNPGNNVTIQVETNYGVGGAAPFTAVQAAKMMAFYNLVNPIIKSVYGPPSRNHTITVVNDGYAVGKNVYYNGPNQVSSSYALNADGDLDQPRLMIHEIIHGYRDNVCLSSNAEWHYDPILSGFEEGFAEGVAIVVMDIFVGMYPNFFIGDAHKVHWNQANGMPFEWDYDFENHPQVTTQDFWSSDIATGSHWLRYGMGATAMKKMYYEDNDVFKNFNAEYYARMNADHTLLPSRALVVDVFATVKQDVERTPTTTWIDKQHIFDCTIDARKKVFMLTFTGLSWASFQHDNRIFFLETHQNGLEWKWNSSDQGGMNEVPDGAPNADWAWTHQLNNVSGDINFIRDWNNTNLISNRPINANGHWINESPNGNPAYIGTPLLGPYQGPNPYYVGAVFTRDHEQDNCSAVPGCGKRAWAMGSQTLYTTTSSAATIWPTLPMIGGNPIGQRAELNLNESGLFRFDIGFNDPQGPVVRDSYFRLLGDDFIDIQGVFGGIYNPNGSVVDGRMFIEHELFGEEPQLNLTNNCFKSLRTWTSVPETDVNRQGGRSDRQYSVPGKVHAIYVNSDCSEKKIDFRTIGYGDGLDGTQMLLFNKADFEDIVFIASGDTSICEGDNFTLGISNNFPDIFSGDSRLTYTWKDPSGNVLSNDTVHNVSNIVTADSGLYTVDINFFGCPVFSEVVQISIGNPTALTLSAPDSISSCETLDVNLSVNSISGASYTWTGPNGFSDNTQNPILTNVVSTDEGFYVVNVTAPGCGGGTISAIDSIELIIIAEPVVIVSTTNTSITLCEGDALNLDANGTVGASYLWTGPNNFTTSTQNPTLNNVGSLEEGIYQVVASLPACSGGNTTDTAWVDVTINLNPVVIATVANDTIALCEGEDLNLTVSSVVGANYEWTGPDGFTSSQQNPTLTSITLNQAGTYVVVISMPACDGSLISDTAQIVLVLTNDQNAFVSVPNVSETLCEGDDLNLEANGAIGSTYLWTGPDNYTTTTQNPTLNNVGSIEEGTYQVVASLPSCTGGNTTDTAWVDVIINMNPVVSATTSNDTITLCEGEDLNLAVASVVGANYEWIGPNGYFSTDQNPVIDNITEMNQGFYFVEVSLSGCNSVITAIDSVFVEIIADPILSISTVDEINACLGDMVQLQVSSSETPSYSWTGPNDFEYYGSDTTIQITGVEQEGSYLVTGVIASCNGNDFIQSNSIIVLNVNNLDDVTLSYYGDTTLCPDETLSLLGNASPGAFSYTWFNQDGTVISSTEALTLFNFDLIHVGNYLIEAQSEDCPNSIFQQNITVGMNSNEVCYPVSSYYIPTAFSPNGDGENDVLYVYGNSIKHLDFVLFDRFGEVVFTSDSITKGWDGTWKGVELNSAVFTYKATITFSNGDESVFEHGNITLMK
jgi:gliding motility-associated-like protein